MGLYAAFVGAAFSLRQHMLGTGARFGDGTIRLLFRRLTAGAGLPILVFGIPD